ncbi:hypothetical protein JHD53_01695 [Peptacetobacter hiranonis]|uniref:hypothetical protein n=1 Tax=Peptacetobacter hiranonis TaxID=89152 RepID=UPI001916E0EB|nr:hypothetical protein [Peptacetobacter hiranonis]QQQ86833.1 hypothetical protein JHD53_01695 [Peptacetobacter hiranonis]
MRKLLEKLKIKEKTLKYVSFLLIVAIFIQSSCVDILSFEISEYIENISNIVTEKSEQIKKNGKVAPVIEESKVEEVIKIYNFKQLENIGTDNVVKNNDGVEQVYSKDSKYMLMKDIKIPKGEKWNLPEDFEGEFVENNNRKSSDNEKDVYDKNENAIKIYNNYQLNEIGKEDSPVMSNDGDAEEFGMGKPVYGEDSSENMTYDESNDYIISEDFTEEMPDLIANSIAEGSSYPLSDEKPDGRTYPGQVTYNYNGKDYILIGNESQLRAIGSNKFVTPRLYLYVHRDKIGKDEEKYIPYYPGDADLDLTSYPTHGIDQNEEAKIEVDGSDGYIFYKREGVQKKDLADIKWDEEKGLVEGLLTGLGGLIGGILDLILPGTHKELCGVNSQGLPDATKISEDKLKSEYKKYRYSSDADYIIFRDVDLSSSGKNSNGKDDNWNPISISGNVKGWKSLIPDKEEAITISNVNVLQQGELDTSNGAGIGFFGSISNRISEEESTFGHSTGTTVVENLSIENISVENQSTKVKPVDMNLIKLLLGTVGGLLGGILGAIDGILGTVLPNTNLKLGDMLVELLTLNSQRADMFATGSFAGRVVGDVNIKNCETVNATVKNVKDISGGFVGYTEGTEKYDGLSEILGGTVKVLSKLLNILPGVGLGDLIKLLLEKDIALGHLIPVGYYKPTIENCNVTLNNIGSEKTSYNGGFVGIQIGTNISDSNVNELQSVTGSNFVGGFAGISRDAILKGLLKDLGIDINAIDVKSIQNGCVVTGNGLSINALKINKNPATEYSSNNSEEKKQQPDGDYAGGFNGAMSNSKSKNCNITGLSSVKTEGSYAGGFTGRATTGFGVTLGDDTARKSTLLSSVLEILNGATGNNENNLDAGLLSLVGIEPTILINSNVNGSNIEISAAENYSGGYIGQGDGVKINPKSKEESGTTPQAQGKTNVENILSVTAKNYSGGVAGSVSTADAIGLLNNTLGVGSYIKFEINNVEVNKNTSTINTSEPNTPVTDNNQEQTKETLNGTIEDSTDQTTVEKANTTTTAGMKINSEDAYAAGGMGLAVGGDISNVNINDISSVNAKNYAAGFIGRAGAGGLADVQGINLLGLGIIKISNVLSLAQGIDLNIDSSNVNGNSLGYTVESTGYQGDITHKESVLAGGFIAEAAAIKVKDSHVKNLKSVTLPISEGESVTNKNEDGADSFGGGFVGRVNTEGLVGLVKEEVDSKLQLPKVLELKSVLGLIPYLIPKIEKSTVTFYKEEKPKEETNKPKEQVANGEFSDTSNKEVVTKLSNGEKVNTDKVENTLNDNKQNINKDESNKVDNGKTEENKTEGEKNPSGKENNTENVDMWKNIKANEQLEQIQPQVIADYAGGFAGEIESAQIDNSKIETQPEPQPQPEQKPEPEPQPTEHQKNADSNLEQNKNSNEEENKETVKTEQTTEESKVYETKATEPEKQFAVFNLEKVSGYKYAGGFAGNVIAGGIGKSDGLSLLNGILKINVDNLLSILDVYIPKINSAGVKSVESGFVVESNSSDGYAGGYVGRASGAQIKDSDVTLLKHTAVTPPAHEYESEEADSYFSRNLSGYAVRAGRYAGGYVGRADIDSAASAGGGISLLGDTLGIENVLNALDVVSTNIENSNVYGAPGGYSVIADGLKENKPDEIVGHSGGYAGFISGSNLNNCNSYNFEYIIGRETAGGHTGRAEPGNTAAVIESASIIDKVANISENVASVLNTFIPQVIDSETTAVPCGGIVRAEGLTDTMYKRGYAGGYIGHNEGARIKGEKKEAATIRIRSVYGGESSGGFSGVTESANVADTGNIKILAGLVKVSNLLNVLNAVYPTETNTAVYGPLRKVDLETWNKWVKYVGSNGVFGTTLPTEEVKTEAELNKLIKEYAYGYNVKAGRNTEATSPGEYGTAGGYVGYMKSGVITDAHAWDAKEVNAYRASGGFVGEMITGGVAEIGGLKLLDQTILGDTLSAVQTFVPVIKNSGVTGYQSGLKVFCDINTSKNTSIKNIISNFTNNEKVAKKGYSGGFAGRVIGGQIWGNEGVGNKDIEDIAPIETEESKTDDPKIDNVNKENSKINEDVSKENVSVESDKKKEEITNIEALNKKEVENNEAKGYDAVKDPNYKKCYVHNLRRVEGTQDVGGFAGKIENGSATSLDTATDGGLLGGLLNGLVKAPKDLIRLMNATVSTVRAVDVRAWDDWGIVINGAYLESQANPLTKAPGDIKYAETAGGFAGEINGAVIGDKDKPENGVTIENIRTVTAGEHAGGFFGKADVSGIAEVSADEGTSILQNLVNLGSVDALDTFRTYIYHSKVVGAERAGIEVYSKEGKELGYVNRPIYTGNAGGFGGTLLDGSVKNSKVEKLRNVRGINYTGGFVGHSGKSGAVSLENANVLDKFLGATAGVLDVFGSHIEDSSVVGILKDENDSEGQKGYSVKSENRTLGTDKSEIAGGFVGFAELAKIDRCSSTNLMQVASGETAGGFAGETSFAYLASVAADSPIVKALLEVIGIVVKAIYNDTLAELIKGGIKVDLGLVKVSLVSGTDVVEVNLLGIIVRISVNKQADKEFDVVIVEIGDSKIALSCDKLGNVQTDKNKLDELSINLIKANRTRISDSTVTGIAKGYDVFGSGSGNAEAAITDKGYVGGFVGFNNEGLLRKNKMVYADAIKGPAESEVETVSPDGATGIFTGSSSLKSNYHFNNLKNIEAEGNLYSIYRKLDAIYSEIENKAGGTIHLGSRVDGSWNNVYDIKHFDEVKKLDELKDAKAVDDSRPDVENALMVYRDQGSKAVLMGDEPTYPLAPDQEMEPGDMQDPCSETVVINLEKIWKDWKPEQRPNQITFWIWGTYKDEKGQEVWDENAKYQVTITKEQMQDENTWKLYIKNLPAYFVYPGTKKKIYYTYKIKEEEIPDYKVSIDYEVKVENDKNDIYHIIVTNSKKWQYILPETGGLGYAMLYIIGIGLIVIAIETYRRKYKSKQA